MATSLDVDADSEYDIDTDSKNDADMCIHHDVAMDSTATRHRHWMS
jgi:hypothetical protein